KDVVFGYCDHEIELLGGGDDEDILFEDFVKAEHGRIPKYDFNIFDAQLIDNLNAHGLRTMRPAQIAAFQATFFNNEKNLSLQPSDFLGISSTGSGKTHAFLVPVVQKCLNRLQELPSNVKRTPMALIFAHSTALVDGIYQRALELVQGTNVKVQIIAGGYPFIKNGEFDIGICSVGRFQNHFGKNNNEVELDLKDLKYVVIDEADKMIECDEFYSLFIKMKEKSIFATMLFSATSSISVMEYLNTQNYYRFIFGEANTVALSIKQKFWEVNSRNVTKIVGAATGNIRILSYRPNEIAHPFDVLYHYITDTNKDEHKKRFVVFVKRTCVADYIAQKLNVYGVKAVSVYSESSRKFNRDAIEKRNRLLAQFIEGKVHVLVATQLLTRGTDMEVDFVINYDLPLNYFDYVHRCGRTGRNQKSGTAV
uniref:ATP-dependent RNA helicase n=1 Tax=Panagrolaimus sp. ES5 TaxID=591445 RepID=A0AC34GBD0_9BILA